MPESRRQTFGRMVRVHRRRLGYTQEQLAALLQESPQMISSMEQGLKAPSFEKLFEIADFFQVSVDAMMGLGCSQHGTTNNIHADISASDGGIIFLGTQDLEVLGKVVDLFARVRRKEAPLPTREA